MNSIRPAYQNLDLQPLAGQWRAGSTVQAAITFRRPARYLNDAVPDFEREQAVGGTTLLGTIKSGLLV